MFKVYLNSCLWEVREKIMANAWELAATSDWMTLLIQWDSIFLGIKYFQNKEKIMTGTVIAIIMCPSMVFLLGQKI